MDTWLIWIVAGAILMILEVVVPGGIVVFLGLAAILVGAAVKFGWIEALSHSLIAWFALSIAALFFLRAFFLKYFEGDSSVQDVSEEADYLNSLVEVTEEVLPHREGRVAFRGTTWGARSEEALPVGAQAMITGRDGNIWIIKAL